MAVAFVLTYTIGYKDAPEETKASAPMPEVKQNAASESQPEETVLCAALSGKVIPLEQVEDAVFSQGILGQGLAIVPEEGRITAPCDGIVSVIPDSKHAVGLTVSGGMEILIQDRKSVV